MRKITNKKAISPMIGYILLISAAVVMSVIVYTWLRTYIPKAALESASWNRSPIGDAMDRRLEKKRRFQ